MSRASAVTVVEVGPRDGLQNEPTPVPVDDRVRLVEDLAAAGLRRIEVGSFVSPKWVPQMAGTDAVLARVPARAGLVRSVLVPNEVGLQAALAAGADEVAVFAAASETFSRTNTNGSIADVLARFQPVADAARAAGVPVRGYVSCALGCPYEGAVPVSAVVDVAERLVALGVREVSLGDTIGVGTPDGAKAMTAAVIGAIGVERVAVHFHDTYGQALANVLACLDLGVRVIDSAVAGLGGCPYAIGASGNLATEDLVYMLEGLGLDTGVDLDAVIRAGERISQVLGRPTGSKTARARTSR
ncbi:hydroxymethylglutaryl-CoA lyase [Chthonobacter rhizosphaerae]|uniref:hydroxymethylglutaryl-CoA lyase n=1 Tax=Chthonobacter rhizosphaerae TaxID=2735553 RepID=UPI0015EF7865|nr:hydroxymethylglutaryl-CoA lyase [Chthonobacter rhizosphaerae]